MSDLQEEISGIRALFKENADSPFAVNIDYSRNSSLIADQHSCLFCDWFFPTNIRLGQYKKSYHFVEYMLEIEHRYKNWKRSPWVEEELRILIDFKQDLIRDGAKFINIDLAKLMPHRTHSQISEIRKSRRLKLIKENYIFEVSNHGLSHPTISSSLWFHWIFKIRKS